MNVLRNLAKSKAPLAILQQQFGQSNRVTSFPCFYHHFHQIGDERQTTGFAREKYSGGLINLHKSFHSSSLLHIKYSNLLNAQQTKDESVDKKAQDPLQALEEVKKLGLFARFKKMAKDYWYVLIPVHVVTSCCWLGGFYYLSKSGVDIIAMLEYYEFSETIIRPLRDSRLGHVAIAYFLYKIATPARYTITLGGTTFAIRVLSKRGIIKPMLSKEQLVQIYKDKKDEMQIKVDQKKQDFKDRKQEFRDKYMKKED